MSYPSVRGRVLYSLMCRLAAAATVSGLSLGLMPMLASAIALPKNAYEACTRGLLGDGVSVADASSACASALEPRDVSSCVSKISGETDISAADALDACIQVRRPRDMASCVVRIDNSVSSATSLSILDNCTRSLLPDDYSDCVVGLDAATELAADSLLDTCIAADYRLPSVLPNFEVIE
ncbi:MAG: hypothetical protein VKL39_01210 [Leptolyngbyaceae bacterium]|nr:hypothetical protein [Leptolyngbyaceae bacterium]